MIIFHYIDLFIAEEYLSADMQLYKYFKAKFDKKLQEYGEERMKQEVARLRQQNENLRVSLNCFSIKTNIKLAAMLLDFRVLVYRVKAHLPRSMVKGHFTRSGVCAFAT